MEGLATRWTFEFNDVALRVRNVDGWALTLCTISRSQRSGFDAVGFKMAANGGFIEWLNPKAEVIDVSALLAGRRASSTSKFSVYRDEVNERASSTKLNQTNRVLTSLDGASEHLAVEAKHRV